MGSERRDVQLAESIRRLRTAAQDASPVRGLTHEFYRYPARFAPRFAATVIEEFSKQEQVVLDPFMGGGTTVVEALVRGRRVVGNDLNSLGVFLTRVKTTLLSEHECVALRQWACNVVPNLSYRTQLDEPPRADRRMYNLTLPRARAIKKIILGALANMTTLPSQATQSFARVALLRVGQWALNGRKKSVSLDQFRNELRESTHKMLRGSCELRSRLEQSSIRRFSPRLINQSANTLNWKDIGGREVDLVVTSPPYPGVHVLYHRWQVDGRRETPAPYWIADCNDGQGASYYNFGDRNEDGLARYFAELERNLANIRRFMRKGSYFVQMVSFSETRTQFDRYMACMEKCGFSEARMLTPANRRIWRRVPRRRWHAHFKGDLTTAREVVLIHRAT